MVCNMVDNYSEKKEEENQNELINSSYFLIRQICLTHTIGLSSKYSFVANLLFRVLVLPFLESICPFGKKSI